MACRYIYKGHEFNSEMALDDFLIENKRFESVLGDAVFSATSAQNSVDAALTVIARNALELLTKYREWLEQQKMIYNEDGEESFEQPPYIGVNKFLSGLTNEAGELLFPEFREEEYWNNRFSKWKNGDFTNPNGEINQSEVEEFGIDIDNPPRITDRALAEAMRDQMKRKWEHLAKTGTAVHNVLLLIFTRLDGHYNFELTDLELKELINNKIERKNRRFLNENTINEAIRYARTLHRDLVNKFGENLSFYPEFTIALDTNIVEDSKPKTLFGIIDLLIVDSLGRTHILDYKTSIHSYSEFSSAKKSAYSYLMATYQRMLEKYGINTYQGELMVAPIQLRGFRKSGDTYIYDGISSPETFITINTSLNSEKMWNNIDGFMPAPFKVSVSAEQAGETVATWMAKCYPSYSSTRLATEESVIEMLKKNKKLDPDENGIYTFRKFGKNEVPITSDNETDFVKKVTEYLRSQPGRRLRLTGDIKTFILSAIKNGIDNSDFPRPSDAKIGIDGDKDWIRSTLSKYCDGTWEVVDDSVTESYGLIMLKTRDIPGIPNQIDFVRVSTNNLTTNYRQHLDKGDVLKNRKGLTGTFESDVSSQSKNNSLMAEAVNGNVELMETMALINQLTGLSGSVIGNIAVVNPVYADGMSMSNEQLLYCFNELTRFEPLANNKIASGEIRFAKKYELVIQQLNRILKAGELHEWKDEYRHFKGFKSALPNYDTVINGTTDEQIKELLKLLKEIQAHDRLFEQSSGTYIKQGDLMKVPVSLYNSILIAISLLKGVNFRQQLRDHDKWLESIFIHRNGVSGSYLDNPGNLSSETLNLVTKLVTEAYQNTRDELQRKKVQVTKLVDDIKKEAGFGSLRESTIGNLVDLYKDMYEYTSDGNFLFKNPNRLLGAKKKFLEYALNEINKRRFPDKTLELLEAMRDNNAIEYYEVPLALGGSDSLVSTQGMMSLLRAKLSYLNPKTAFERALKKVLGIYENLYEAEEDTETKSLLLYKMANMFDAGLGTNRIEKIKSEGIQNLEHNLETLLLKHMFAYSVQENMDAVFPMIKAAMVHITSEGAMRNKPFTDDMEYLKDYINNKILNKSIIDPKNLKWVNVANLVKQAASKLTLAFAPVQMFYQPLQGLWQDISLMIRKPDGKDSFTFQHFIKATKLVYGDFFHYSKKPTVCKLLNELYGINDMDMNTYIDRISSAKKGFWNFENLMFKFASRPDFYNRMTIFTSQMMGDGCLDAHSINADGLLVYDWKLDERFKAFATNDKSDMKKYNEQKALYYAVALLFVNEHTRNVDGTMFELNMNKPMALPRAYTNRLAESMKSLGDNIYGYYSHEKKSMVMSTALGSLWLQFKTYWSGKKNQYLAAGGVKLLGDWKHYEENGLKYYYQVDADGNILYDRTPTTTETIAPVYQWEGQWQEGIMLTLSDMAKAMWDKKSIVAGFKDKWNESDIKLLNAYRSNIKQFGYDLIMFALIGSIIGALLADWLDDLKNENKKNRDLTTGLAIAAANVAVMSVKNSFLDLNFIDSIGSPIGQWTPFAFEWGSRTLSNWWKVATGDEDFWDGVVKTSGGLKQIKPALDAIKPDMFRTEREGGTFNKKDKK